MNRRTRHNFTLIELLAVMLLMGALMLMMLPAFNQMIRGNKVDQMTANLALGLEQAQARAVSSRRHVAVVFPTRQDVWRSSVEEERAVRPFCYGGFRLAYVESTANSSEWKFIRWVPDSEWKNSPDGAMLINVLKKGDSEYELEEGKSVTAHVTNLSTGAGFKDVMGTLKDSGLTSGGSIEHSVLVFSPYGGLKSDQDLRLVIAEALPSGNSLVFPSRDSAGHPTNWKMLSINKFTGRVEYYPEAN